VLIENRAAIEAALIEQSQACIELTDLIWFGAGESPWTILEEKTP
jgi:hypothetical protein